MSVTRQLLFPLGQIAVLVSATFSSVGIAMADRAVPEDQIISTVLVTSGSSAGSGFYLMTNKGTTFITAKHVLYGPKNELHSEKAQLLSYSIKREGAGTLIELDLKALIEAKRLKVHKTLDIVVIEIATADKPPTEPREMKPVAGVTLNRVAPEGIWGPTITNILKFDEVAVGNDVLVAGFPSSIGLQNVPQVDRMKPLLRRGMIAGRNDTLKTIIIDCPVFPGNSGGPVTQVDRNFVETKFYLIGLVVQFVPFDNSGWSAAVGGNATLLNSGFSVVIPMDPILEMID